MIAYESIHDYEQHPARARRNINLLHNGKTALRFIGKRIYSKWLLSLARPCNLAIQSRGNIIKHERKTAKHTMGNAN
jgi:hypothetical protein